MKHPREIQLAEQLTALERAAVSPPVPGELGGWIEEILRCALEIEPVLTERREQDYQRLIREMRKIDLELQSHTDFLAAESAALAADEKQILCDAQALLVAHRRDGKDEIHVADAVAALKQQVIAFVLRCRTQEAGLATWHQEALMRDRGPVD
jgi:hypothetical protein